MKVKITILSTFLMLIGMVSTAFAADTITINFDPNGGTVATNVLTTEEGKSLPDENTPTRTGSDFIGWSYSPDFDYTIKLTEMKPSADTTLYAHWMTNKNDTFTVVLDANGGSYYDSPRVYVYNRDGTTMDDPTDPSWSNHTFKGWATSKSSTIVTDVTNTSSDATYYAVWEDGSPAPDTCTVTFDSAGGSEVQPKEVDKGTKVEKPTDPTYAGKNFEGWYLEGEPFDFNLSVRQSITLVAHWSDVTEKNFVITFIAGDDSGGSTFSDGAYVHSVNLSDWQQVQNQETPKPTRHQSFAYWSLNKTVGWGTSGATQYNVGTTITDNFNLYATYTEADNSATISEVKFDANGGHWVDSDGNNYDVKKINVDKNTKVSKPDNPKWGSRKFDGWYSTDDDEPEKDDKWNFDDTVVEDITLYAHWKERTEEEVVEEAASNVTLTSEVPQNFPNPENLPVVDPIATGGDPDAMSVKDIPTTGVQLNIYPVVAVIVGLVIGLIIFSTIFLKRGKHDV